MLPKPSQTSITFPSKLQNTSLHTPIVSTADISQENPNHLNLGEEGPKSKRPLSTPYSHVSSQHNILPVSSQLPPLPQGTGASLSGLSFVAVPDKSLPSFSPANASKNESSGSDASLTPPKVSRKRQVGTSPMLNGDSYNLKEPADLSGLHPQKQNDARMERSQSSAEAGCASFRSHGGCDVRTENSLQEGVQVSCPTSKKKVSRKFIGLSGTIKIAPPCNIKVPNREAVSKTDRSIGADHFKCTNVDLNTEEDLASIQRSQEWGPVFFSDGVTEKEPIASTNAVNSHQVCLRFHEVKPMEEKSIGCPRNELNPSKLSQHSLDEPPVVPLIPPLDPTNSRTIPVCPDTRGQNLANLTELTPLFPSSLEEDHSNKLLERPKGDATRSSARKPANPRRLSSPDRILSASPLSEEESRRQSNTGHYNEYRKMMSEKGGGKLQEFSESSMLLDQRRSLQLSSPVLLEKSSKEIFREKNGTRSDARRKKGIFKEKANSVSAILDIARSQGILEQNRNEQKYAGVPKIVTKQIPFSKDGNTTSIKHPTSSGKRGMSKRKNRKNPKYRFLHEEQYNESMFLGFDEGRKDIFPPLDILGLPSEDAKLEEKKGCQNVPERTKNDDESEMKNCSHGVAQPVTTYNSNQPHYDMSLKHHERRKENKDAESTSYSYAPSPKPPAGIDEVSRLTDALIGLRGLVNHSIKTTSSSRVANSLTSNASLRKKSSRKKSEKKYDEGSQDFINISHGVSSARPIKSPRKAMDYPSSQKTSSQKTKSASRSKPERREVAEDDCIRDGNASHAEERKIGEGDSCSLPGPSFERVSEALDDAVDYHSVQGRRPLIGGGGPIDEIKNAYPRGDVNVRLNNASKNGAVVEKGNKTPCDYNFKSHTPDHVTSDFGDIKNNLIKTLMDTTNVLTQVCAGWS